MENASKALIIAGAILLSIVLITLGVLVIGRGQDAIEQTNIDDQVVSTWNQKWTKYEGKSVSGTTVNNMINEVISSNQVNKAEKEKVIMIKVAKKSSTSDANNSVTVFPKITGTATTGGIKMVCSDGRELELGVVQCSKYAKSNAKYEIETAVNKYGYICEFTIKY